VKPIPEEHRGLVAALALGAGVPFAVFVGLGLTLGASLIIGRFLPEPAFTIMWLLGSVATCVMLWFLVRAVARAGGWRSLAYGLGAAAIIAAASYALGVLTQSVRPGVNGMAGIAWILLGYVLGLSVIVALIMGVVAMRSGAKGAAASTPGEAAETDDLR
jgi:hypothetical protein